MPTHPFFWGLLHYYQIKLQHLNPNEIQQYAAFIVLCEGFLGIKPHFELWRYFFVVSLVKKRDGSTALIGCAEIHLSGPRAHEYMAIAPTESNKGWHSRWFYIKNHDAVALPVWSWGLVDKKKKRLAPLLSAIAYLKGHGLCGTGRAYHSRRVAPLMARALPMYGMAPHVWLEGLMLAQGLLWDSEIQQRIWEVLDEPNAMFLVEGHPAMRPDTGLIDLVSTSRPPRCVLLFSRFLLST
jgi:hypothetical protein